MFVRYLVDGKPHTSFLKMVDLCDGTAETIEKKILDVIGMCKINVGVFFSFGSDGAAVMTGRRTGIESFEF